MTEGGEQRSVRAIRAAVMLGCVVLIVGLNWISSRTTPREKLPPPTLLSEDLSYRLSIALKQTGFGSAQTGYPLMPVGPGGLEAQALDGYETVARQFPHDAASRLRLGIINAKKGYVKYARRYLSDARELDPDRRPLFDLLLVLYSPETPPSEQLMSARSALDTAPAWIRDMVLPDLYEKAGDKKSAEAARRAEHERNKRFLVAVALLSVATVVIFFAGMTVLILWAVVHVVTPPATRPTSMVLPRWSLLDFLEAFALWLFVSTVFAVAAGTVTGGGLNALDSSRAKVALLLCAYIIPAATVLALLRKRAAERNMPLSQAFGWSARPGAKLALIGLAGYAAAVPLTVAAALVSRSIVPVDPFSTNPAIPVVVQADSLGLRLILLGLLAVVAPFVEETVFRGVGYSAFRARWGVRWGIILSAAVFALMHHNLPTFLPLLALGAVFAYLYETTGSVVPSIVAHACQNAFTALAFWLIASL